MTITVRSAPLVVACLVLASSTLGQEPTPRFGVATLKPSPPPTGNTISINLGAFENGRLRFTNVTLNDLLLFAYDLPSKEQLVGLDWMDTVRFDIEALGRGRRSVAADCARRASHR